MSFPVDKEKISGNSPAESAGIRNLSLEIDRQTDNTRELLRACSVTAAITDASRMETLPGLSDRTIPDLAQGYMEAIHNAYGAMTIELSPLGNILVAKQTLIPEEALNVPVFTSVDPLLKHANIISGSKPLISELTDAIRIPMPKKLGVIFGETVLMSDSELVRSIVEEEWSNMYQALKGPEAMNAIMDPENAVEGMSASMTKSPETISEQVLPAGIKIKEASEKQIVFSLNNYALINEMLIHMPSRDGSFHYLEIEGQSMLNLTPLGQTDSNIIDSKETIDPYLVFLNKSLALSQIINFISTNIAYLTYLRCKGPFIFENNYFENMDIHFSSLLMRLWAPTTADVKIDEWSI